MALELRPLTLAELLDRSFSTYKHHVWLFAGIMAVPSVIALLYAIGMQLLQFSLGLQTGGPKPPSPDQMVRVIGPMVLGSLAFLGVYMTVYAFALGATTIAVAHLYRGIPISVSIAYREVRRHGGRLIVLLLWTALRIGGAWLGLMILCGILGFILAVLFSPLLSPLVFLIGFAASIALVLFLMVRYGVSVPAVVLENKSANEALARSVSLTEDHRGRVFLLILCAVVITYATAGLLQGPFIVGAMIAGPGTSTALVLTLIGAVLGAVGGMFSGPIMIVGLAMIYYDLRIRKEALDLQIMLEALDATTTTA